MTIFDRGSHYRYHLISNITKIYDLLEGKPDEQKHDSLPFIKLLLIEAMLLCVPIVVALLNLKNDFVVKDSPTVFISPICNHCHPPSIGRHWFL